MAEFTGERAIPGRIEPDLWNEHVARYLFAARLSAGQRVLDAGCGAGYGAAMLAERARWVSGVDVAPEAIEFARSHYRRENLAFLRASVTDLPFREGSFDLVVCFEVIEHLPRWEAMLAELRRVLAPEGLCLISTPNRLYYGEARGDSGPNPYHHREFDWRELREELGRFFPAVSLYAENHTAALAILPIEPDSNVEGAVERDPPDPAEAHFLLAACALAGRPRPPGLLWAPRTGNLLRERERHIAALERELAQKDAWLAEFAQEKQNLLEMFRSQALELERSNLWARSLDEQLSAARERILELQRELAEQQESARRVAAGYEAKVAELERELAERAAWAQRLEEQLTAELAAARAELEARSAELAE
ncbi:MAG: methyltransferase domain-containing protein, partial [Bryobacterales bacterium]|nr:methyltransferase domain-containing protein [Bryobacteraceae bacterium]MDW8131652.1 methyltransferase domain-containing protein [Bryobacterales bacterium]